MRRHSDERKAQGAVLTQAIDVTVVRDGVRGWRGAGCGVLARALLPEGLVDGAALGVISAYLRGGIAQLMAIADPVQLQIAEQPGFFAGLLAGALLIAAAAGASLRFKRVGRT